MKELVVPISPNAPSSFSLILYSTFLLLPKPVCFCQFNLTAIADERKKLDGFTLFDTGSPQDMKKPATMLEHENLEGLQAEDKYGIRRSLAWDSAFFTSPGVFYVLNVFLSSSYL